LRDENDSKMQQAWNNEEYELQMKTELRDAVMRYLTTTKIKKTEFTDEIKEYLMKQANRIAVLRAVGDYNQHTDELEANMYLEVPTRLIKQLKRLWICLKSLSDNYSDDRAMEIIEHIVNSSGNSNRSSILHILRYNPDDRFTINGMKYQTKLGYRACKRELEALWNLGLADKTEFYISKKGNRLHDASSYQINIERYGELLG